MKIIAYKCINCNSIWEKKSMVHKCTYCRKTFCPRCSGTIELTYYCPHCKNKYSKFKFK